MIDGYHHVKMVVKYLSHVYDPVNLSQNDSKWIYVKSCNAILDDLLIGFNVIAKKCIDVLDCCYDH